MNNELAVAIEVFDSGNRYLRAADRRILAPVLEALRVWLAANPSSSPRLAARPAVMARLAAFLDGYIEAQLDAIIALKSAHDEFLARIDLPASDAQRRRVMLEHLRTLGATRRQLRADARALRRNLDVLATGDRLAARVGEIEQRVALALRRHGEICAQALADLDTAGSADAALRWRGLNLDSLAVRCFDHDGDPRVVQAAFACLATAVRALPQRHREALDATTLQFIYRAALDDRASVWVQREALALLAVASPEALQRTLQVRLESPQPGDDAFVRARAAEVWAGQVSADPALASLAEVLIADPADLVRQRLARVLPQVPLTLAEPLWRRLASADDSPQVRAAALLSIADTDACGALLELLRLRLAEETDAFVYRVGLETLQRLAARDPDAADLQAAADGLFAALAARRSADPDLRVRRWSAQAEEQLRALLDPDQRALLTRLAAFLDAGVRPGTRLPPELARVPEERLGRACAVLAQRGQGLDLGRDWRGRWRVWRGFTFGRHVWRILHELRHPATDKRQAFRHTTGRLFFGNVQAPSGVLAEVSPTGVPGEPRVHAEEDSWRPWLPLVDQLLAVVDQGFRVLPQRIYTSEGITEIAPPASAWGRLRAWWVLTTRYAWFARLRTWEAASGRSPDAYVNALRRLGFQLRLRAYTDVPATAGGAPADTSVTRFFALVPLPWLADQWAEFRNVFFSPYQNTLGELVVFAGALAAWFAGRHAWLGLRMRRMRAALPLVIGGWGTRGKSGTERLKAALVNALGYGLCAKTTGCEAMLVLARPFRRPREIALFRPYDKATIWEQFDVTGLAARMRADVMLWECMGLTPSYVQILQQRWMRDDIATITNAFPDHEDIQGPAGINIPEVMCEFIPRRSLLLTSEEAMLPILEDDARRKGTALRSTGWLEAGLICEQVMARFPYQEHRYNVALVLQLADTLGVERDLALKEMADRVVMDVGVLKRYPEAEVDGRRLQFIMGMSANERYGALGNWTRMGMDRLDIEHAADTWVTTLVNNRADRVARSQVFARLLVEDIGADAHVFIGTNLKGMRGYVDEALQAWLDATALTALDDPGTAVDAWRRRAGHLRLPLTRGQRDARLRAIGVEPPAHMPAGEAAAQRWLQEQPLTDAFTRACAQRWLDGHARFESIETALGGASNEALPDLERRARALLADWFEGQLVWVDNPGISGDALARLIAARTPQGLRNVTMGMQNIKGAGLAYVYSWQAWEAVDAACAQLEGDREADFVTGLERLGEMPEFGVLTRTRLRTALDHARHSPFAQREVRQAQIAAIERRLEDGSPADAGADADEDLPVDGLRRRLLRWVELLADAGDAVDRRRRADRIYADLAAMRISESAAAAELQRINARQRGGWLSTAGLRWPGRGPQVRGGRD